MADAKERLGKLPCSHCKEPTPVRRNAAGTLSMACQECGWSTFARKGDQAHADLMAKLEILPTPAAPAPAPTPTPAPKPAAKPWHSGMFERTQS